MHWVIVFSRVNRNIFPPDGCISQWWFCACDLVATTLQDFYEYLCYREFWSHKFSIISGLSVFIYGCFFYQQVGNMLEDAFGSVTKMEGSD